MTTDSPYLLENRGSLTALELWPGLNEVQWTEIETIGSKVIADLESRSNPKLLVDLSQLNYIGSAQVALIVRVWKSTQARNGRMAVACPHPMVQEVLDLAGLSKLWDITSTPEDALRKLGVSKAAAVPGHTSERSGSAGSIVFGAVLSVVIAVIAGGLLLSDVRPDLTLWGLLGFATLGFVLGIAAISVARSMSARLTGIATTILSVILLMVGALRLNDGSADGPLETANPEAAMSTASSKEEPSPQDPNETSDPAESAAGFGSARATE